MQIINFLTFIIFNKLLLSKSAELTRLKFAENNHTQLLELNNQNWHTCNDKSLLESEIPTQITIYRNNVVPYQWDKKAEIEQKPTDSSAHNFNHSNTLLKAAKVSFEEQTVNAFIAHLDNFNCLQEELSKGASYCVDRTISICSSFEMSEQQKQQFTAIIQAKINPTAKVKFKVAQGLNYGIELRDRGYKIFGNLDYHITELVTPA